MFKSFQNLAIFCPINNELITPNGEFITVPPELAEAAKRGNAAQQAQRLLKHWAVNNRHLRKGTEIAMFH